MERNHGIRTQRREQANVKYLTKQEVERFFAAIPRENIRDLLLFDLIYRHGMRRSEATLLWLEDVRDGEIWIPRQKNGDCWPYRLHERSKKLLRSYLKIRPADDCPYLFRSRRRNANPISGGEINRLFHRYAKIASLPPDRSHVHAFRHSIGVHLADIGWDLADVQWWLGHRDIESTTVYFSVTDKRKAWLYRAMLRPGALARTGKR